MYISECNSLCFRLLDRYELETAPEAVLIQGKEGMGKTALLNYLLNRLQDTPNRVYLLEAGAFARKFAFLAQQGDVSSYRKELRSCDLLLIDNIHSLKGKKKSVEELFYTLQDILAKGGKTMITTSDPSFSLSYLGARFSSRLSGALNLRIEDPSPQEKAEFIAYYCQKEGITLRNMPEMQWQQLNLGEIVQAVRDLSEGREFHKRDLEADYTEILARCEEQLAVSHAEIVGKGKRAEVVKARNYICYRLHHHYHYSYQEIALFLGNSINCIKQRCNREPQMSTESPLLPEGRSY